MIKYAKIVGYVIYIDGFIKLSRGKIPQNGNSLLGLDKFISKIGGGEFSPFLPNLCRLRAPHAMHF